MSPAPIPSDDHPATVTSITPVIVYDSVYGATRTYAEHLARISGTTAMERDAMASPPQDRPLVVLSPNYAGTVHGVGYLKTLFSSTDTPPRALLAIVGMSLSESVRAADPAAKWLGALAPTIPRVYLPGRLTYSSLSRVHKTALWSVHSFLKAKRSRTPNDEQMLADYGKDIDRVDLTELDPIIAWINDPAALTGPPAAH